MPTSLVPTLRDDLCEYLKVSARATVRPGEYSVLKQLLGATDEDYAFEASRTGAVMAGKEVRLRELIVLHAVSKEDAIAEAGIKSPDDPEYMPPDEIGAHLHIDVVAWLRDEKSEAGEPEPEKFSKVFDWLRENRGGEVSVTGGRRFSRSEFEPVVQLPAPVKPFTSVSSVGLVREADQSVQGGIAYEVYLQELREDWAATVQFRTTLPNAADALDQILRNASEIASFGFRKRVSQVVE